MTSSLQNNYFIVNAVNKTFASAIWPLPLLNEASPDFVGKFFKWGEPRQDSLALLKKDVSALHSELTGESQKCFSVDTLVKNLKQSMEKARKYVLPDEVALKKFGNKHINLVKMAELDRALDVPNLVIPLPEGIASGQVHSFLRDCAPDVFTHWEALKALHEQHTGTTPFLDDPRAIEHLKAIDAAIEQAFASVEAPKVLLSPKMSEWLRGNEYLMVRSTGAEDSKQMANAGGNVSKAYVPANPEALCAAAGEVVRSYFSQSSLQNRLNGGLNPFAEDLKLAVTAQQLIGEPVGGSKDPSQIPVSFVLFTNMPHYIGNEKFRVMRLSGTYGHGEGVVSNQGISTDTILILQSESHPDQLYYLYDSQKKPERLAPVRNEDGAVALSKIPNPKFLQEKRAFSQSDLRNIFANGVLMEAFFNDHPTDIEGVLKDGTIYFVQARPVNQKALLPTYLDVKANPAAIVGKLHAEALVTGKASVLTIDKKEEVLFAPTLEEAERRFNATTKLIVVAQPEPANSHPVVNFSGLSMPCLYVSDEASARALLDRIDADHPLAVCMQTATLNLWDRKIAAIEEHIRDGFAVHPAKIALSLTTPQRLVPEAGARDGEIEQLLRQIRDGKEGLDKLEQHPQLLYLRAKLASMQSWNGKTAPQSVLEHLRILQELNGKIARAIKEMRTVLKTPDAPLQKLLHAKILETLLVGGNGEGLGHYSLLDVKPLCDQIATLTAYQAEFTHPTHTIDLLIDGQQAGPEAFKKWRQFLYQLEPLITQAKISPQEWDQFKNLIITLRETGALPTWLTFFQNQTKSSWFRTHSPLDRFHGFIDQIGSEEQTFITSLQREQQSIQQMRASMDRFTSPASFPAAWKELQGAIERYSSRKWLSQINAASPIARSIAYKTMAQAVDLLDTAAKTVKSSGQFQSPENVRLFKEILGSYYQMMRSWAEQPVLSGKIPLHWNWPLKQYLDQVKTLLNGLPDSDPTQLQPSRGFSVSAAILGAGTEFGRHYPERLEDMLTLLHQNSLVSINALNQELISPEQIRQSLLPQIVKDAMALVEETDWGAAVQRIGMEVKSKEIILRYNIPLRNHSGHIDLHYDIASGKMVFKGQLLGPARERWAATAAWIGALEEAGIFSSERPLSQNEQELTFSWGVAPENLKGALREYAAMAEYSLNENPGTILENIIARWPEHQTSVESYCLQNINAIAAPIYRRMIESGEGAAVAEMASAALINPSSLARRIAIDLLSNLFYRKIVGSEVTMQAIRLGVQDPDIIVRYSSLQLLSAFVREGHGIEESVAFARKLLTAPDVHLRQSAFSMFRILVENAKENEAAINAVRIGIQDTESIIRGKSLDLCSLLVKKGLYYQDAIDIATVVDQDTNKWIRISSLSLRTALVEKGQDYEGAIEIARVADQDANEEIRTTSLSLHAALVEKGQDYEGALAAARRGLKDPDEIGPPPAVITLWTRLAEKGIGVDEAVFSMCRAFPNRILNNCASLIKTMLQQGGHIPYEIVIEVVKPHYSHNYSGEEINELVKLLFENERGRAAIRENIRKGITDADRDIRYESFAFQTALLERLHDYEGAIEAARIGINASNSQQSYAVFDLLGLLIDEGNGMEIAQAVFETNGPYQLGHLELLEKIIKQGKRVPNAANIVKTFLRTSPLPALKLALQLAVDQDYDAALEAIAVGYKKPDNIQILIKILQAIVDQGQVLDIVAIEAKRLLDLNIGFEEELSKIIEKTSAASLA